MEKIAADDAIGSGLNANQETASPDLQRPHHVKPRVLPDSWQLTLLAPILEPDLKSLPVDPSSSHPIIN